MFHFRGPSQVGDRLVLKAIVNNSFKNRWVLVVGGPLPTLPTASAPSSLLSCSMEVGVSAEAYGQEMSISRRHINSAFMTFVVLDQEGQPRTLPMVAPEPGVRTSRAGLSPAWWHGTPWNPTQRALGFAAKQTQFYDDGNEIAR